MYELCYEVSWMNYYRLWERYQRIQMITCTILTSKLLVESLSLIPPTRRQQLVIHSYSIPCRNSKIRLTSFTGNVSHVCNPH